MSVLDLARLRQTPLIRDPFEYVVVEQFVPPNACRDVIAGFPELGGAGSYPLDARRCGPGLTELADELTGEAMREAIEDKFAIDLAGRPTMITLRGYGDGKDGRIHTDSTTKLITVLLYLNEGWAEAGGRLRMLRGPEDLDDYAAEVAPLAGTMIAFRRSDRSFHGHQPHIGPRRSLQLNWVTDASVVRRELSRHRWSARVKALNPFA